MAYAIVSHFLNRPFRFFSRKASSLVRIYHTALGFQQLALPYRSLSCRPIVKLNPSFEMSKQKDLAFDQYRSSAWLVLLAIAATFASLEKQAEAQEEELSWTELEKIAQLFELELPKNGNAEDLKQSEHKCFYAVFQSGIEGDWNLLDRVPAEILSKLTDVWGQSLLIAAAGEGNDVLVTNLIKRHIALAKKDPEENTALHIAAKNGFSHLIPLLWSYYIDDVNKQGKTSLHIAIEYGQLSVLKELTKKNAKGIPLRENGITFTPLALCVRYSQKLCLDHLLAQPKYQLASESSDLGNLVHLAVHFGQLSMLNSLLKYKDALSLLEKPDSKGRIPLALACFLGDCDAVEILYKKTNDPQAVSHDQWTLAHWAAAGRHRDVLELLNRLGAYLNKEDVYGKTPKSLLKNDSSIEAKSVRNTLKALLEGKSISNIGPLDYSRALPEGVVFKGGGPRGLAYLEALRALNEKGALNEVQRTAGTSAGAITAAVFALDPKLRDISSLENIDLMKFLDPVSENAILLNAMLQGKEQDSILAKIRAGSLEIAKETWNPITLYRAFYSLEGICKGDALLAWIEQEIHRRTGVEYCTFGELAQLRKSKEFLHLHVYATRLTDDVNTRILHFSSEDETWKDIIISDAIRASMSIPGVYKPYVVREKTSFNTLNPRLDLGPCVDGGLVKNFPIDAFDTPKPGEHYSSFNRRTLGLCLKDVSTGEALPRLEPAVGIVDIAKACASVYWQVEEIYLKEEKGNKDRTIEILIQGVGLCDFNLTPKQRQGLLDAGRSSIENDSSPFSRRLVDSPSYSDINGTNLISKLVHFTGRKAELNNLENVLAESANPDKVTVRLIYGLGGMGKTELTRAFAQDHRKHFSIVWFISNASKEQQDQSYRALAEELRLPIGEKEPSEQIKKKVHVRLQKDSYKKPWLLIYDNTEETIKEEDLPRGGYIFITSRKRNVWRNDASPIELTELSQEESEKMLVDILKKPSPHISELARRLGNFPLALNQAAYYILDANCTVEDYLNALNSHPTHNAKMSKKLRYHHTVSNVWNITLESLKNENSEAFEWLSICAYLNPDDIPYEWLATWLQKLPHQTSEWDKMEITKSIGNLSLIKKRDQGYSMHRLLQQAIQEKQASDTAFQEAWDLVNEKYNEKDAWFSQAKVIEDSSLFNQCPDKQKQVPLLDRMGLWHRQKGNYQKSYDYDFKVLKIRETIVSVNNSDLARSYSHVGGSLRDLGKYEEALSHQQKSLEIRKQTSNHSELASAYASLAKTLKCLERNEEALEQQKAALQHQIEALKMQNEPSTVAQLWNNLGISLEFLGKHEKALESQNKALNIRLEKVPPEERALAQSYNNIGRVLNHLGRHKEALDNQLKSLEIREAILHDTHPELAQSHHDAGIIYESLGKNTEALKHMKIALEISIQQKRYPDYDIYVQDCIRILNKQTDIQFCEQTKQELLNRLDAGTSIKGLESSCPKKGWLGSRLRSWFKE